MGSEPPVLLGYLSGRVPDDDQTGGEALSKFGGKPVWIDDKAPKDYPFICCMCGAELDFVCQVATPYCANKRCLYLFGCHNKSDCSKSSLGWKVVRCVVEPEQAGEGDYSEQECECIDEQEDETPADPSDWLQAAFGSRNVTSPVPPRQKAKGRQPSATLSSALTSTGSPSGGRELMPPFFIHVEDEPPDASHDDAIGRRARELQLEYEQREKEGSAEDLEGTQGETLEAEAYEERPDKVFLKLQKRLSRSPTQLIRYSFGGRPFFISPVSNGNEFTVDACPHCRSERVFEMQLVPAAANEIHKRRNASAEEAPVEWGVVAVFTCKLKAENTSTADEGSSMAWSRWCFGAYCHD